MLLDSVFISDFIEEILNIVQINEKKEIFQL